MKTNTSLARFPVVLIDGASCSGKSTIKTLLENDAELNLGYAKRHTTRRERPGDALSGDYIFIDEASFKAMETAGEFIESKDFLFGMSYGTSWAEIAIARQTHRGVIAMINLGNIAQAKAALPWALGVLIDAPIASITRRLVARGLNSDEQIAERIASANMVTQLRDSYDYVCFNDDGALDASYQRLRTRIMAYLADERGAQ